MLTLLQPAWLALLLLAIPVLLLHMRRRRSLVVGSVQIWRQVSARATAQRSRKPPPFSWQLLLQLLAVTLLALALSQPVWSGGAPSGEHLIVVLDNSIAMRATGQPEEAHAALAAELNSGNYEYLSVLLTSAESPVLMAHIPVGQASDWQDLLPAGATAAAADWDAIERTLPGLLFDNEQARLLVLAAPASVAPESIAGVAAEIHRFDNPAPGPWLQDTRVDVTDDGLELHGLVHLPDDGAESIRLELYFRAFGDSDYLVWSQPELRVDDLTETADALYAFNLPVELPLSGVLRVQLSDLEPGPLTQANHVVHVQPVQARVLLLGDASQELVRALAAVEGVALFTADNLEQLQVTDFDLVVTTGLPLQTDPQTSSLSLILPAENPLQAPLTTHWSTDHVLSQGVNWAAIDIPSAARVPLLPGATEVFSGNGLPLVQARTVAGGRQVVLAFDPAATNWPELTGFPAFMGNVLDWVLPGLFSGNPVACEAGQACALAAASLGSGTHLESENGSRLRPVQAGPTVLDFVVPLETGVLWPSSDSTGPEREPLAVNAASVPLPGAEGSASSGSGGNVTSTIGLWQPIVVTLLMVLLAEAVLQFLRLRGGPLRGAARRRQLQGMVLRGTALLLTTAAAMNLVLNLPASREQVVVLVGSNPADDPASNRLLERAIDSASDLRRGQTLQIVDYRGDASLFESGTGDREPGKGANLQAGLNLALASLNPAAPGRVLLASSGVETSGDLREVLPELQARSTTVDVLPLQVLPEGEVLVERVVAPAQSYAHDRFTLHATITADTPGEATMRFYRNGELILTREQQLQAGRNIVELLVSEAEAGEVLFEVEVEAAGDTYPENNRNGIYLQVLPPARILVVAGQSEWGAVFADALRMQGLDVTVVRPDRAPFYLDGWLSYQGIVLMDVPSIDLSVKQQELIEQAVAEHGRGLLILGGPNSYGPGGYYETVLEKLSPLSSRVPRDAPNVALAFVLDRSGSMQQTVEGDTNRLDIARQATITAAGLLHEESRVSVIVFDTEANVLVPLQERLDLEEIEQALTRLEPGGGTSIYPGLEVAYEQLQGVDAAATHVIVMSDGLSQPGDFETLLGQMTAEGITVSVVAIGDGADVNSLQRYARMGGGAFHATTDFRALPSILSQESMMLSGAPIEENHVQPAWISREQTFVQGLPLALPAVDGFVLTTAKDDATVHLQVPDSQGEDFPLLASWRYGNGHVLAFTSQAAGSWTAEWLPLPEYPLFWSQALRTFLPATSQQGINLQVLQHGTDLNLNVEVLDAFEQRIAGQKVTVNGVPLRETRTGYYQGTLPITEPGRLELHVQAGDLSLERSHHVPYPAQLDFSLANPEALANLAEVSGGRLLSGDEPLFTGGQRVLVPTALWPWLLLIALILFLLELVYRYDPALLRREARS